MSFGDVAGIAPSVIGAGASLYGGYLEQQANEDLLAQQLAFHREMAQNSISWRVEDAKRAGLHPLYALGAPTFSPSVSAGSGGFGRGVAEAGAQIARGVSARMTPAERLIQQLQIKGMENANKKDEAIAGYYSALASKTAQDVVSSPGLPSSVIGGRHGGAWSMPGVQFPVKDYARDVVEYVPSEQKSARSEAPYLQASTSPGFKVYTLPGGMEFVGPDEDLSELYENLGPFGWILGLAQTGHSNLDYHVGAQWRKRAQALKKKRPPVPQKKKYFGPRPPRGG